MTSETTVERISLAFRSHLKGIEANGQCNYSFQEND